MPKRPSAQRCSIALLTAAVSSTGISSLASAQYFGDSGIDLNWTTIQTAYTYETPSGAVLCEESWNAQWDYIGESLVIDDTLDNLAGGCPLVSLGRVGNASADAVAHFSATLHLLLRIEAAAISEISRYGAAAGNMTGTGTAWVEVDQWITADLLLRFIADAARENALTNLDAVFTGPIDPQSGDGVLVHESWTGSSRIILDLDGHLLAPGRYELRAMPMGEFRQLQVNRFTAQASGYALLNNPAAANPPVAWDINGDGSVDLDDGCLWADSPSDVDDNGVVNQQDLSFLLALARAAGHDATDNNLDGVPDQCDDGCPADFNQDGDADFFDVQAYLGAFVSENPSADLNNDEVFDFFDVLEFLNIFAQGC